MRPNPLLDRLAVVLGEHGLLRGDDIGPRYFEDVLGNCTVPPLAVLRPVDTGQVSAVLRLCHEAGAPLVTQGGRTGLAQGQLPRDGELALSLERMNAIQAVDEDGGTATVQAGVVLQALQERLEPLGLTFPLDLGARGSCTVGGNISTNAGGNRVIRHGMTRDLVVGLEAVLADGTVLDGTTTVLKNNTGLDLKQLFIGSEGAYGVVTRAVLRLAPLPAERGIALCATRGFAEVRALLRLLRAALGAELTAFEVLWPSYAEQARGLLPSAPLQADAQAFHVLVEASGPNAQRLAAALEGAMQTALEQDIAFDALIAKSGAEAAKLWQMRDMAIEVCRCLDPLVPFDVSVAIVDMAAFTEALDREVQAIDPRCRSIVFGHVGDGNLHLGVHAPPDRDGLFEVIERVVYALVGRFRGSVSAEHGIGWLKREFLHHTRSPAEVATMRTIKLALDPKRILNRDRIFEA